MTIVRHELKRSLKSLAVWTASIGFFIVICVFMFPQMKSETDKMTEMFASMGSFTAAFGMDRLNFGTLIGFYAVECGNILGIGGAFFAALIAALALSKEEKDSTAEFLLAHPISRARIVTEKLVSVFVQIAVVNLTVFLMAAASIAAVGETVELKEIVLVHLAYFLMQLELAGICLGISAFSRNAGAGVGIGIAAMMYFLNIIANISEKARFLKYISAFGYTDAADIVADGKLNTPMVLIGMAFAVVGIAAAYGKYMKKDIH